MIETIAWVRAVEGNWIEIEAEPPAACNGCAAGASCGTAALVRWFARHPTRLRLYTPLTVAVGERVLVGLPEEVLPRAAARLYLVPVLGLIGGALLGQQLGSSGDGGAVLGALLGMALALGVARRLPLPDQAPVVLRRLREEGVAGCHRL